MLVAGFLTTGKMRLDHFTPHKNETRLTHYAKEWGLALCTLTGLVRSELGHSRPISAAGNARMLNSVVLSAPHSLPQGLYISMLFWLFIMLVMGLFETSAASLEVVRGFIGFPSVSLLFYLPISLFCPCIYNRQPVGGGRICVSMALTLAMLRRELAVCRCARDR